MRHANGFSQIILFCLSITTFWFAISSFVNNRCHLIQSMTSPETVWMSLSRKADAVSTTLPASMVSNDSNRKREGVALENFFLQRRLARESHFGDDIEVALYCCPFYR